jgi:tetratricopeptide (TPR) repeat protein
MGQLEEALAAYERAHEQNPKLRWVLTRLAVAYANLGRNEEARNTLEPLIRYYDGRGVELVNLRFQMYLHPFKDKEVEKRFAEGLIKAGLTGEPGEYYKIHQENKLTGDQIKDLIFDQTVTGFDIVSGKQWWIKRNKDGKATYHGPKGYTKGKVADVEETSDTGKSWVDGNRLCNQWANLYGGLEDCFPIYNNPEGMSEKKDEYIGVAVYGFVPFSVAN